MTTYCNIPPVVPATEHNQLGLMVKLLGAILDLWFDQEQKVADSYQLWTASANLENLRSELLGTNPCEACCDMPAPRRSCRCAAASFATAVWPR